MDFLGNDRLAGQLKFLLEADKLKDIIRRSYIHGAKRRENSAEHSWHIALGAMVLSEHASDKVDMQKVIKMLVIHDIVEIDAGDTFLYDEAARKDQSERERKAAERIFGILPPEQRDEFTAIWNEFEEEKTSEARFAKSIDRLMPLLHNYATEGKSWQEHAVTSAQVFKHQSRLKDGSETLWQFAEKLITDAISKGYLH